MFCSGLKRPVFTAGNDLKELYPKTTTRDRYRRFWKLSNTFLSALYESPLLTISAINGQCAFSASPVPDGLNLCCPAAFRDPFTCDADSNDFQCISKHLCVATHVCQMRMSPQEAVPHLE